MDTKDPEPPSSKSAAPVIIGLIILALLLIWLFGGSFLRDGGGELNSTVPVRF